MSSKIIPTVDQIARDTLTQISYRYWHQEEDGKALEPFDAKLIEDIYTNELLGSKFSLRRIMLLEFSQYLENYLWKNFNSKTATQAHVISIAVMVNEKFRERISAWECFQNDSGEFGEFFHKILLLCLNDTSSLNYQEQLVLLKFLDNCINSLEVDLLRVQIQKICSLPMWISLSDNRRQHELGKYSKLKKFWKAIEKKDQTMSPSEAERAQFERTFFKRLIESKFLATLKKKPTDGDRYRLNYLECFLELFIDLQAQLATRRFFNTLLEDMNVLIHCRLSPLCEQAQLFGQLYKMLEFYCNFEINDQTGEAMTEHELLEMHYDKLKSLQKGVFKYFRDDLITFSLTNIATIDKREELLKHLDSLTEERLYSLAEYLHLVPFRESNRENFLAGYDKQLLLEMLISHVQHRTSQLDELNSLPLYPTEETIWDENLVPVDYKQSSLHDTCVALPKLNLQFLTLHDYLLRNFHLFRLESAYELRQDIEDACIRPKPYYSFEEQCVSFASWSRMAQPIVNFTLIDVGKPRVGEVAPSRVRANVSIDLEYARHDVKAEWQSLRKYDICFLVTLRPFNTQQQAYNPNEPFLKQMGSITVRGCEIEGMLNNEGKLVEDYPSGQGQESSTKFDSDVRIYRVNLDANQYKIDNDRFVNDEVKEDIYTSFNVLVRRRPKENNFKSILESIRDLMNTNFVVPVWLRDLLLGYGDPHAANYKYLKDPAPLTTLDFRDTFLDFAHLEASFPGYKIETKNNSASGDVGVGEPPYRLTFDEEECKITVEPHRIPRRGPYPANEPKKNQVKFTPTQIEAIKSGMQPGLTLVVGPPGTGKTDVAVQIISNIYHQCPEQKILIVTHSNQALNQLFEKIMHLDIDERHLLRLGHGEEGLETEKDFSRYGRVDYVLATRLRLLDEVDRLEQSLIGDTPQLAAAYSCETAIHFYINVVQPRWESYTAKVESAESPETRLERVETLFPFTGFFSNAPQPLFKRATFAEDYETAKSCFRYIKRIFKQLEEFRAFELIRNGADRAEYLLVKEAKIIAMTCTHAALRRRDLVKMNFRYDNIIMEEAAQILEIETFIPLLLQNPDHNGNNRLKRWIMIGDHNQLPPVIKNMTFQKYSNMEQSLFTRFVKLNVPTIDLDAQGRCRAGLCELFKWRYQNLNNLKHVEDRDEFRLPNPGLKFDYQLVDVGDFNGQGESEPQPFFYQNLAEAEYCVALFMYMRMIGYPGEKITILSTYNGQKHLIRDVLRKRCAKNPIIGQPKKITTVDKYQGQQNDYVILSLVRTKNVGHLRDVRRLIVAVSRARLGLYIFARAQLFKSCFELTPVFNILAQRPTKLTLMLGENYPPTQRPTVESLDKIKIIHEMPEMTQFVFDFYQSRLNLWKKSKREQELAEVKLKNELRSKELADEEKVLREKLNSTIERNKISRIKRLNIEGNDSSSSSSTSSEDEEDNEQKPESERPNETNDQKETEKLADSESQEMKDDSKEVEEDEEDDDEGDDKDQPSQKQNEHENDESNSKSSE